MFRVGGDMYGFFIERFANGAWIMVEPPLNSIKGNNYPEMISYPSGFGFSVRSYFKNKEDAESILKQYK